MHRWVLLGLMAVVLSGCALLQAVDGPRLASRAVTIARCLGGVAPGSDAARRAQEAADDARAAATDLEDAVSSLARAGRAIGLMAPYVADAHRVAPRAMDPWYEFADRAAQALAYPTDRPFDPVGLFDLAAEALDWMDDAVAVYDRVHGDLLAVRVLSAWSRSTSTGQDRLDQVLRDHADPGAAAAAAFRLPDHDAEAQFRMPIDAVRSALTRDDDNGTVVWLQRLGEQSRPVFGMAPSEAVNGRSIGDLVVEIDGLQQRAEAFEQQTLGRAAALQDALIAALRRAERAARAHPACLPTGPLGPETPPGGGVGPVASPGTEVAAPGG